MKDIVLLSGGMDSATCLAKMINIHGRENVMAVGFNYGQKHSQSHKFAEALANFFCVKLINLNIDTHTFTGSKSSLLAQNPNTEIEHKTYTQMQKENGTGPVDTYIPFRNGLMLAQAASLAFSLGASTIVYGAHKDDCTGGAYPDCSLEFCEAMDSAILSGTDGKVKVYAPLINASKAQGLALGYELGVPFDLTRTCYEGRDKSCGKCATCRDRIRAFKKNKLIDPVPYEIEIDWTGCKNV